MENVKKNMENVPYIVLRRIDCSEQKAKDGSTYYMFSGLLQGKYRIDLVTFYTRDKDLYADILAIPMNKEFKLYYELNYSQTNGFKVVPISSSL